MSKPMVVPSSRPPHFRGQSVDLLVRLAELLRDYRRDLGLFKEFIQNADDAGASVIRFILDRRSVEFARKPDSRLESLAGPALLIANDRTFAPDDLASIQKVGESSKARSARKTGRFGLGFNTAYNVTDFPCFVSENRLFCFDPHRTGVADGTTDTGAEFDLEELWRDSDLLELFAPAGLDCRQESYPGTIFRLPLRSPEQAPQSHICKDPFPLDAFYRIVDDAREAGASLLLFTRSLLTIEVLETSDAPGAPLVPLFRIDTSNADEVRQARTCFESVAARDVKPLLESWMEIDAEPPVACYEHRVELAAGANSRKERWRVVAGAFLDKDRSLVRTALDLVELGEKAVPWAGAAVRVEAKKGVSRAVPVSGKVACGQPLPLEDTGLPLHVNGWFDVDSGRRLVMHDAKAQGATATARNRWNELLARHAVAVAAAEVLASITTLEPPLDPASFYAVWPDPSKVNDPVIAEVVKALYAELGSRRTLHIVEGDDHRWEAAADAELLPNTFDKRVEAALLADGVALAVPRPPVWVRDGFDRAIVEYFEWTPAVLREYLAIDADLDMPLAEARPALQRLDWVKALLDASVADATRALGGLPLALGCDARLHTFGCGEMPIAIASEDEREIFTDHPEWFVDPDFVRSTCLAAGGLDVPVLGPGEVLRRLPLVLPGDAASDAPIPWRRDGELVPRPKWLARVFNYLAAQQALDEDAVRDALAGLHIIPDQLDQLHKPGNWDTPLLFPDGDTHRGLREALTRLRVPFVCRSQHVAPAVRRFADRYAKQQLVSPISAGDLAGQLGALVEMLAGSTERGAPEVHVPILDYLASEQDLKSYTDRQPGLERLAIFPTLDGEPVAVTDQNVFMQAGNIEAPVDVDGVRLLQSGPDRRDTWTSLQRQLGAKPLDALHYAVEVLLPNYSKIDADERLLAVRWLRDNNTRLKNAAKQQPITPNTPSYEDRLRATVFLPCADGKWRFARDTHDPTSEHVKNTLASHANLPDGRLFEPWDEWKVFFKQLGMSDRPTAQQLAVRIDALVAEVNAGQGDSVRTAELGLLSIFRYLDDDAIWEPIARAPLTGQQGTTPLFVDWLRNRAWIPAKQAPGNPCAAFKPPVQRLYTPGNIYPENQIHRVGSQKPVTAMNPRKSKFTDAVGFRIFAPLEVVLQHLPAVVEAWEAPGHSGLKADDFAKTAAEILRAIGFEIHRATEAKRPVSPIEEQVRRAVANRRCIWDTKTRRFLPGAHVFASNASGLEPRRAQVSAQSSESELGLATLGRRMEPVADDYLAILRDIAADHGTAALPERDLQIAQHALRRLDELGTTKVTGLFVPTTTGILVAADRAVLRDSRAYDRYIQQDAVHWLSADVPFTLVARARISRLSRDARQVLTASPTAATDPLLLQACAREQNRIRSRDFRTALVRLMRHARPEAAQFPELGWLAGIEIQPAERIPVELRLRLADGEQPLGTYDAPFHFEDSSHRLYLARSAGQLPFVLSEAINRLLGELRLSDCAPLEAILSCDPASITDVLDGRNITFIPDSTGATAGEVGDEEPNYDGGDAEDDEHDHAHDDAAVDGVDKAADGTEDDAGQTDDEADGADEKAQVDHGDEPVGPTAPPKPPGPNSGRGPARGRSPGGRSPTWTGGITKPGGGGTGQPDLSGQGAGGDEEEAPPTTPGLGRSPVPHEGNGQSRRIVTYVVSQRAGDDAEATSTQGPDEDPTAIAIGRAAEDFVEQHERDRGAKPKRMPHNNPGYDIECEDADGGTRYIEVKGLDGAWGNAGVPVKPRQFEMALEHRDRFWLYVVEHARTATPRLTCIQDPATQLTEYRFDAGWRALGASPSGAAAVLPRVGQTAVLDNNAHGEIVEVIPYRALAKLRVRLLDGSEHEITYSPSMKIFDEAPEAVE